MRKNGSELSQARLVDLSMFESDSKQKMNSGPAALRVLPRFKPLSGSNYGATSGRAEVLHHLKHFRNFFHMAASKSKFFSAVSEMYSFSQPVDLLFF